MVILFYVWSGQDNGKMWYELYVNRHKYPLHRRDLEVQQKKKPPFNRFKCEKPCEIDVLLVVDKFLAPSLGSTIKRKGYNEIREGDKPSKDKKNKFNFLFYPTHFYPDSITYWLAKQKIMWGYDKLSYPIVLILFTHPLEKIYVFCYDVVSNYEIWVKIKIIKYFWYLIIFFIILVNPRVRMKSEK